MYDDKTDKMMNLVFHLSQSDDRKKWLTNYKQEYPTLDRKMNMSRHLDKEHIKYSLDDCGRSLPNIYDGMKESQRKILYSSFLKNLKNVYY